MKAPATPQSSADCLGPDPTAPHAVGNYWHLAWVLCAVCVLCVPLIHRVEASEFPSAAAVGEPQSITLQTGAHDTFLDSQKPTEERGLTTPDSLRMRRGAFHTLLWFDLTELPEGADVLSATLGLYAWYADRGDPLQVEVYGVLRPWTDVEATWNGPRMGESWNAPGCRGAGTDRTASAVSSGTMLGINRWHGLDVTGLVRSWTQSLADNHGLLLAPSAATTFDTYYFRSADWRAIAERPRLVITYTLAATPTVTAALSPTAGATPSATPSPQTTATLTATPTSTASKTHTAFPTRTTTKTAVPLPWRTPVPNSLYPYPEQRIGFVAFGMQDRDVQALHAGLAKLEDRGPYPFERDLGLDFTTVFQVHFWKYDQPDRATYQAKIRQIVADNPGYLWFIGNEPEALCRGNRAAPAYAEIYHDMYNLIKGVDPSAQVGIGGVVVPSRFRLRWLEQALDAYKDRYGTLMPIDVWSVHNLLLGECPGPCQCPPDPIPCPCAESRCSGAYMPVGQQDNCAVRIYRTQQDQANVLMFEQLIWDMRRWMAGREEARGKPLILTEMGVFADYLAEGSGSIFPHEMINQFMADAFDFLLTAADPNIGCTSDGGRLVQRWTWYSLDHNACYCPDDLNGSLTSHGQLNDFGVSFGNYTAQFLPVLPITFFVQKGWSGYAKDPDTTLSTETARGNADLNFVKIQADGSRKALLRFELPEIPANVEVVTATLSLRSKLHAGTSSMLIACYGVRRPWDVGTATFNDAMQGVAWQQPGCAGPLDRDQSPVSSVAVTTDGVTYVWDVTQLAQQWAADPASNHGVLLQASDGSGAGYWYFVSSNQVEDGRAGAEWTYRGRPKLELSLRLRESTPTPTSSATASPSPSATNPATVTSTATRTPTQAVTTTPTVTRAATPTRTATPTPIQFQGCVQWDYVWREECNDAAMPRWYSDLGQGQAEVQGSTLRLSAAVAGSDRFPLLWTRPAFPVQDCVTELRFRFGTPTGRGTAIGIGTQLYDGRRFLEGDPSVPGIDDMLRIHQASDAFTISLWEQVIWTGVVPDTAWHVVQVVQDGMHSGLYVDGRLVGVASARGLPRSIFLGAPTVSRESGAWTPLDVDYVRVGVCRCRDTDMGCR